VTECKDDRAISNLVPIIVGAALGGLILIVLVAYLIGRKRSRRGYEQVWIFGGIETNFSNSACLLNFVARAYAIHLLSYCVINAGIIIACA